VDSITSSELRYDGTVPLYIQLSELIRRQINSGQYATGAQLPTEKELCDRYSVSTITVRQAVIKLVNEGLLFRRRGKGTFVTEPKLDRDISRLYSFSDDMRRMGRSPSSRILDLRVVAVGEAQQLLGLSGPEQEATKIIRLRLADGIPLLLETTFIPLALAPDLARHDLASCSLYTVLQEQYGITVESAVESFESTILDAREARLLGCPPNSAGFHITRLACSAAGTAVELTTSRARADRCKFSIVWGRRPRALRREFAMHDDRE
jgi:GntR family transcriptional regulator